MDFKKQVLAKAPGVYSVAIQKILGQKRVLAAPEGNGQTLVFSPPSFEHRVITTEPGGCMGFAPHPEDDKLFIISGFYPIFKAEQAGVDLLEAVDSLDQLWRRHRIVDLPFVHRICVVRNRTTAYLVAATVCGGKEFQDDWSKPGTVYAARIPDDPADDEWRLEPVLTGLHRNHGMCLGSSAAGESSDQVYIAADEGVFLLQPPGAEGGSWTHEKLLDSPASEVSVVDLDGDGREELAVIEPFHGNQFSVYKHVGEQWQAIFSDRLDFGHGLWGGKLLQEAVVMVGNRGGHRNLVCYRVRSPDPFAMDRIVIDPGSGTTNLDVITAGQRPAVIAANGELGEYALYHPQW